MKKTTVYRRPMDENLFEEELTIEFLGIHTVDDIPDEKTVWHVKNILSKAGTFDALFDKFRSYLDNKGLSFNEGKIIDAVYTSCMFEKLNDPKTGLFFQSSGYVYSFLTEELQLT